MFCLSYTPRCNETAKMIAIASNRKCDIFFSLELQKVLFKKLYEFRYFESHSQFVLDVSQEQVLSRLIYAQCVGLSLCLIFSNNTGIMPV